MVELRWINKRVPAPEFGKNIYRTKKVLQSRFWELGCLIQPPTWTDWQDIPLVEECSHGNGLNDYCEPCGRINGG